MGNDFWLPCVAFLVSMVWLFVPCPQPQLSLTLAESFKSWTPQAVEVGKQGTLRGRLQGISVPRVFFFWFSGFQGVRSASLRLCSKHGRAGEGPGRQRDALAATSNGRWCSPGAEADLHDAEKQSVACSLFLNKWYHQHWGGSIHFFSCESILTLFPLVPWAWVSSGSGHWNSAILCFCLGLVVVNGACLCSGQFFFRCWVWFPAYCKDNLLVPGPTEWLQLCEAPSALQGSQLPTGAWAITRLSTVLPSCSCCKCLQLASSPSCASFVGVVRGGFAITNTWVPSPPCSSYLLPSRPWLPGHLLSLTQPSVGGMM